MDQNIEIARCSKAIINIAIGHLGGKPLNILASLITAYYDVAARAGWSIEETNRSLVELSKAEGFQESLVPIFEDNAAEGGE